MLVLQRGRWGLGRDGADDRIDDLVAVRRRGRERGQPHLPLVSPLGLHGLRRRDRRRLQTGVAGETTAAIFSSSNARRDMSSFLRKCRSRQPLHPVVGCALVARLQNALVSRILRVGISAPSSTGTAEVMLFVLSQTFLGEA